MGGTPSETAAQALALLRTALNEAPPDRICGPDAARMARLFAEAERMAAAGKTLYARRVAATAAHEATGHRDTAGWLADVSGSPIGQARTELETADKIAKSPAVQEAFEQGRLSPAQAKVISGAAVLNPTAAASLVEAAEEGSFRELKDAAARAKQAVRSEEDEVTRERRVHAKRFCKSWVPEDGGIRIDAWLTTVEGSRLLAALEKETDRVFMEAWAAGDRELHECYRADALVRLVCGPPGARSSEVAAHLIVRVDAGALQRGSLGAGEVCEVPGVGPISVHTARELWGDCFYSVVVTDGIDIKSVTSTKRTIPRALRIALMERDPVCVVPGCGVSHQLEFDHWRIDYGKRGPTELANLCRLCSRHHTLKTARGWRLTGGPGRWKWVGPAARGGESHGDSMHGRCPEPYEPSAGPPPSRKTPSNR